VKELETEGRKALNGETEIKVENNTPTAGARPDPERSEGEGTQALRQELEAEKQKAAGLVEQATKDLQDKVNDLEAELATRTGELETLQGQLTTLQGDFEGAKAAYAYAVEDYKQVVLQANPLFTADIIGGDTIEAVKASVDKANALVGKVKEGLEAQAKTLAGLTTVPAGAPVRSAQSTEGLSTKEKINLGLEQARKKKES
jgi:chromosome segregation ATPase